MSELLKLNGFVEEIHKKTVTCRFWLDKEGYDYFWADFPRSALEGDIYEGTYVVFTRRYRQGRPVSRGTLRVRPIPPLTEAQYKRIIIRAHRQADRWKKIFDQENDAPLVQW